MKKRVFTLILALAIVATSLVASIPAFAGEEDPMTTIEGHNLALKDNVYILYYVDFAGASDEDEKGVLVWTSEQENYTYGTETAKARHDGTDEDGREVYYFTGVSAKMMSQDIYAVSYIKDDDGITYSELDKYSVLQYCYNKKDSPTVMGEGGTTLGELVQGILDYGTLAQTYFRYNLDRLANAEYYEIKVKDGTLPDGTKSGLFQTGEQVTLNAPAEKDGVPFSAWKDESGATVATKRNAQITVGTTEKTYTAVYEESYDIKLMFDCENANIGEEFSVILSVESVDSAEITAISIFDLQYDSNALEFLGFPETAYGELVTKSQGGVASVNPTQNRITIGYVNNFVANGLICELRFRVKNSVLVGTQTTISMQAVAVKNKEQFNGIVISPVCVITVE